MTSELVVAREISVRYGDFIAVRAASLSIRQGEIVGVSGPNGAGKSTLLKAIAGILPATGGDAKWRVGEPETEILEPRSPRAMVKAGITLVPEGRRLFAGLSVEENLRLGSVIVGMRKPSEKLDQVYEIFPKLLQRRKQDVNTLSGGERQMVAIGRGLMTGPRLMLVDELSLGLAPVVADDVYQALLRLNVTLGLALVLVDESLIRLNRAVQRLFFMQQGTLSGEIPRDRRQGSLDELFFASASD